MTNNARSATEIEREIEQQRSNLSSNIEDLQDKFSIDGVVNQVTRQVRENSGDITRTIARQVKENPIPFALTVVGLAWMIFGKSGKTETVYRRPRYDDPVDAHSQAELDFQRAQMAAGRPYTPPTAYVAPYDEPEWAQGDDLDDYVEGMRHD